MLAFIEGCKRHERRNVCFPIVGHHKTDTTYKTKRCVIGTRGTCEAQEAHARPKWRETREHTSVSSTPWTIRYVIRYFSFNILRCHPAMHIEGFNIHALEGVIHIARSISFVAVAAISIDKTKIFLKSPAICIVLTIRWSMSNAIHIIAVHNIATMCAVNAYYSDQYDCLQYLQYVLSY